MDEMTIRPSNEVIDLLTDNLLKQDIGRLMLVSSNVDEFYSKKDSFFGLLKVLADLREKESLLGVEKVEEIVEAIKKSSDERLIPTIDFWYKNSHNVKVTGSDRTPLSDLIDNVDSSLITASEHKNNKLIRKEMLLEKIHSKQSKRRFLKR